HTLCQTRKRLPRKTKAEATTPRDRHGNPAIGVKSPFPGLAQASATTAAASATHALYAGAPATSEVTTRNAAPVRRAVVKASAIRRDHPRPRARLHIAAASRRPPARSTRRRAHTA